MAHPRSDGPAAVGASGTHSPPTLAKLGGAQQDDQGRTCATHAPLRSLQGIRPPGALGLGHWAVLSHSPKAPLLTQPGPLPPQLEPEGEGAVHRAGDPQRLV